VDEVLGFEPDGDGEHLLVQVQKRNLNTDQVARQLARHAGVPPRNISYAGLKDRVAITSQWFSIHLPGKPDPDWASMISAELRILQQARHRRKLPRGALQANRFNLVLRDVDGLTDRLLQRLTLIKDSGVPNYFGEQRFGHDGRNVATAQAMFDGVRIKDKHLRSLYLSAARSFLFNQVLARRVSAANWNRILPGEAVMLVGSRSFFVADVVDDEIESRRLLRDISPSGPLWGTGGLPAIGAAAEQDTWLPASFSGLCAGLEAAGLKQERRALRLDVAELQWQWLDDQNLSLQFGLPGGCYATAVLRELINNSTP